MGRPMTSVTVTKVPALRTATCRCRLLIKLLWAASNLKPTCSGDMGFIGEPYDVALGAGVADRSMRAFSAIRSENQSVADLIPAWCKVTVSNVSTSSRVFGFSDVLCCSLDSLGNSYVFSVVPRTNIGRSQANLDHPSHRTRSTIDLLDVASNMPRLA